MRFAAILQPHLSIVTIRILSRYLRGLMGTFNERAEKLMDKLSEVADNKTEENMLSLVNCVTLDVIAKVFYRVLLLQHSK